MIIKAKYLLRTYKHDYNHKQSYYGISNHDTNYSSVSVQTLVDFYFPETVKKVSKYNYVYSKALSEYIFSTIETYWALYTKFKFEIY